jgi:formamidopyrimidine-DNA glycosylase
MSASGGRGGDGPVELPEVEVVRRDLEKDVVGRRIREADVRPQRNAMRVIRRHARRKEFSDRLAGKKIARIDRKGKYVLMYLDGGDVLVVHFGMSGQLLRKRRRRFLRTHVVLEFMQG